MGPLTARLAILPIAHEFDGDMFFIAYHAHEHQIDFVRYRFAFGHGVNDVAGTGQEFTGKKDFRVIGVLSFTGGETRRQNGAILFLANRYNQGVAGLDEFTAFDGRMAGFPGLAVS
jgi:hypothetical protein